jgi:hypothetical protein
MLCVELRERGSHIGQADYQHSWEVHNDSRMQLEASLIAPRKLCAESSRSNSGLEVPGVDQHEETVRHKAN